MTGSEEDCSKQEDGGLDEDQSRVGLHVVDLLPGVVLQTGGVDKEIPSPQSGQTKAEQETFQVEESFEEETEGGEHSEPEEENSVRHSAAERSQATAATCPQAERIPGKISEAESEKTQQDQREEVQGEGQTVVDGVPPGQARPGLELLQHKVHPSLPLNVLTLLVTVLQLGPDIIEIIKQLLQTNYQMTERERKG